MINVRSVFAIRLKKKRKKNCIYYKLCYNTFNQIFYKKKILK